MKHVLSKTSRLIFMLFLSFLLFNGCEKDSLVPLIDEEISIETRGKCTSYKCGPTVKVTVPAQPAPTQPPPPQPTPAAQQLHMAVCNALQAAADAAKDAQTKQALQSAKAAYTIEAAQGDSNFLGSENFAGVAFPYHYMVYDTKGKLIIVVIPIQILEQPTTQMLMDHEDGHSYISKEVTKKVAEKAANDAKNMNPKPTPAQVADKVRMKIKEVEDEAQAAYDAATDHGTKGDQDKEAKKAAQAAIKKFLHPPK